MDLGLKGVHVLVTGASGGIGVETAKLFLDMGANVTAHYNRNLNTLTPLVEKYTSQRIKLVKADLSSETDVQACFSTPVNEPSSEGFGPVQVLVVNHAISSTVDEPIAEMSLERWEKTITTNLTSSFLCVREYLRQLKDSPDGVKNGAEPAVVFIGSTAGKYGEAGNADYAASKSAMMYGLLLSLKNEIVKIAPKGRVNCVAPGWVRTPMAEHALQNPSIIYKALATTPLKKIATPSEIATQVAVLASSTVSGHVTGQIVMVEGGMEGRLLNSPEDVGLSVHGV